MDEPARFSPRLKGDLTPRDDVRMTRLPPDPALRDLVQQWWIPVWNLAPGTVRDQRVLGYPVCNLVVQDGAARLYGPTTRGSTKRLTDRGWAVGAMLTPAAGRHLTALPMRELVDGDVAVPLPATAALGGVHGAMAALTARIALIVPDADDVVATELLRAVEEDQGVRHVEQIARRLHRSARTLQRLALRNIGLTPAALIRRRRLQDAAARVRAEPDTPLAEIAADFGFADHAHLSREFAVVLGFSPSDYRADDV